MQVMIWRRKRDAQRETRNEGERKHLKQATDRKMKEDRGTADSREQLEKGHGCPLDSQLHRAAVNCQGRWTGKSGSGYNVQFAYHLGKGWDEFLIIFRLSGLRKETHLGLMSKQANGEVEKEPPYPASMGGLESCVALSSILAWGSLYFSPLKLVCWLVNQDDMEVLVFGKWGLSSWGICSFRLWNMPHTCTHVICLSMDLLKR